VGARDFLVAYNINLNTTSTRRANAIAFDVRERGRVKREGHPLTGKIVKDAEGNPVMIPGSLKAVKAIGWYIEEYGVAQISMNLTNISVTSIHEAFDEVCRRAEARGIRVTGSEIVGLVPLKAMLDAGRYFLRKQQRSLGVSDATLIKIAVKSMGLDELGPFDPHEKIIEYKMRKGAAGKLADKTLRAFMEETASESVAPGGGSVSAYIGSTGVALATMVANLSSHKRGWDERWEFFSEWAVKGKELQERLLELVDADTEAFNRIMAAYGLPKSTDDEKAERGKAIADATIGAIEVPFRVMQTAYEGYVVADAMIREGNPNSVTDAGVAVLAPDACIGGAWLNVQVNAREMGKNEAVQAMIKEGEKIFVASAEKKALLLARVEEKIVAG
ncbi:MAG: cyclodeaminase/cyclohydrolase family protein, partial [Bacteroidales bacterium]|nr:cyclodeaminase/cyclohydrolase family protein [Bacteroidales bacterium]